MASILVVDDERSMREFLEILLAKQGHEVATESDVAGALERLSETEFDLVLTDLRLGSGSGIEILE
jgi:two-component system response regulator PilR (NtrC family)